MMSVNESTCKCFLCESDVSNRTILTKLTGSVTKVAIDVLHELYKRKLSTFTSSEGFICYKCKRKAESLCELSKKVETTTKELLSLIAKYWSFDDAIDQPTADNDGPPSKTRKTGHTALDEQTVQQNESSDSVS
uniref:ZAD domain-containing protein n=1 Tax=Amphimedon queenslandica TaxID=400682 RepID=A0A1X7V5L4_AMPQE